MVIVVVSAIVGCAPQVTPEQTARKWVTAVVEGDLAAAKSLTGVPLNDQVLTTERLHIIGSSEPTAVSGVSVYVVSDPFSVVVESVSLPVGTRRPDVVASGGYEVLVSRGRSCFVEATFGGVDGLVGIGQ
ncbi:MAG: hypothetical protein FDZ75_06685 [Actinobacteria bacterium]|nr:MAG: hypothetical protein FDZ75_06685 [Actinomycetota bacterium]